MNKIHTFRICFLKSEYEMEILVLKLFSVQIYALLGRIRMCVHYNTVLFCDLRKFQNKQLFSYS